MDLDPDTGDLLVTISRGRPDGGTEYIAHSADPEVVSATLAALERALGRGRDERQPSQIRLAPREADATAERQPSGAHE